jgi:hypothetical protein
MTPTRNLELMLGPVHISNKPHSMPFVLYVSSLFGSIFNRCHTPIGCSVFTCGGLSLPGTAAKSRLNVHLSRTSLIFSVASLYRSHKSPLLTCGTSQFASRSFGSFKNDIINQGTMNSITIHGVAARTASGRQRISWRAPAAPPQRPTC